MSLVWLDGTRVTPEERDDMAATQPARKQRRSLLGRIFGPWAVVERAGSRAVAWGRPQPVWRVVSTCCEREAHATTSMLRQYTSKRCAPRATGLCRPCWQADVMARAAQPTTCRWCGRPSQNTDRRRRADRHQRGSRTECEACLMLTYRNGRRADGSPVRLRAPQFRRAV